MVLLLIKVLDLLNQQELIRDQTGNSGKALLRLLLQQRGSRTNSRIPLLACSLRQRRACSLYGVRVGVVQELTAQWFAHPLGGIICRGHAQFSAFTPHPLLFLSCFQSLCVFCPEFAPTVHEHSDLQSRSFLVLCSSRRGLFMCKHCSTAAKGPRPQPVSV